MNASAEAADSRAQGRAAAASLAEIAKRAPRVHCITNAAASVFTANALLAIGAVPSLTVAPEEIGDFVAGADALLVNLGTLDETRRAAIAVAVDKAAETDTPWVLDPVFANRSVLRLGFAAELCVRRPAVIHANEAEIVALAGGEKTDAAEIARRFSTCVVMSGPKDRICDGARTSLVANGHPLMGKVTAMGCVLGALVACFCAVERDPFLAALRAVLSFGVAGEIAGARATGPGSFQVEILDALYALDAETLERRGRLA